MEDLHNLSQDFLITQEKKERDLIESVFAPGNLVHGTWHTVHGFQNFFTNGIRRGKEIDNFGYTPDLICFSILGEEKLPERYLHSGHFGPRYQDQYYSADNIDVAFVISRERLLAAYPNQLYAVGSSFWEYSFWNKVRYGRVLKGKDIHGIPIKHPGGATVFKDEVRLYPLKNSDEDLVVTPDMYVGLVAFPSLVPTLLEQLDDIKIEPLPIFSPQCQLITYAG